MPPGAERHVLQHAAADDLAVEQRAERDAALLVEADVLEQHQRRRDRDLRRRPAGTRRTGGSASTRRRSARRSRRRASRPCRAGGRSAGRAGSRAGARAAEATRWPRRPHGAMVSNRADAAQTPPLRAAARSGRGRCGGPPGPPGCGRSTCEHLLPAAADRDDEPAPRLELLVERRGQLRARPRRRRLRRTARPRAGPACRRRRARGRGPRSPPPRARPRARSASSGMPLDRVHLARELGEHCGLVARAGADVEHLLVPVQRELGADARDHVRLRDRLVVRRSAARRRRTRARAARPGRRARAARAPSPRARARRRCRARAAGRSTIARAVRRHVRASGHRRAARRRSARARRASRR